MSKNVWSFFGSLESKPTLMLLQIPPHFQIHIKKCVCVCVHINGFIQFLQLLFLAFSREDSPKKWWKMCLISRELIPPPTYFPKGMNNRCAQFPSPKRSSQEIESCINNSCGNWVVTSLSVSPSQQQQSPKGGYWIDLSPYFMPLKVPIISARNNISFQ